jgi:hypothetical protein
MMDKFTQAYIECALWSSTNDAGDPLDSAHDASSIAPETLARMQADCAKFQADNARLLTDENYLGNHSMIPMAGHDFWLTRNGHGAGFWDGDWAKPAADLLTASCKQFGGCDLYLGDDALIHSS